MVHTPSSSPCSVTPPLRQSLKNSHSQLHLFPVSAESPTPSMRTSGSSASLRDDSEVCVVCLENPRTTRLSCGHEIMCRRCAIAVMKTKSTCPTCRAMITKVRFSKVFGQCDFVPDDKAATSKEEELPQSVDKFIEQRVSHEVARRRSVDENKLVLDGACRVADQLKRVCVRLSASNCLINYLSLADNFIGPAEALILAEALSKNQSVRFLNLSNNLLGSEGTKIICEVLRKNRTITSIHLNTNQMDEEGAEAVARVIEENRTIQILRLYENSIRDKGVKVLSKALKSNTTLTELSLRSNRISTKGLQYLAKKTQLNSSLMKLDIGFNNWVSKKDFPSRIELTSTYR